MKSDYRKFFCAGLVMLVVGTAAHCIPNNETIDNAMVIDTTDSVPVNSLGGKNGVYQQAPSRADYSKSREYGKSGSGLKIAYDKRGDGGPRNDGGFCGFYTIVHKGREDYVDATAYKYLTFWVRGETGVENFKVGAADKQWAQLDDSLKSKEIGKYLPAGKVTTEWQLAVIPLTEFTIDWAQLHVFSVCFEADVFENGAGQGSVFIDEIALTRELPAVQ